MQFVVVVQTPPFFRKYVCSASLLTYGENPLASMTDAENQCLTLKQWILHWLAHLQSRAEWYGYTFKFCTGCQSKTGSLFLIKTLIFQAMSGQQNNYSRDQFYFCSPPCYVPKHFRLWRQGSSSDCKRTQWKRNLPPAESRAPTSWAILMYL